MSCEVICFHSIFFQTYQAKHDSTHHAYEIDGEDREVLLARHRELAQQVRATDTELKERVTTRLASCLLKGRDHSLAPSRVSKVPRFSGSSE